MDHNGHYNATGVDRARRVGKRLRTAILNDASERAVSERRNTLSLMIAMVYELNGAGHELPVGEDLEAKIDRWGAIFQAIPTYHMPSLLKWLIAHRTDRYPIKPLDLTAAWADRYDEEDGAPGQGFSFARDEHGKYLRAGRNENTGLYPWGNTDIKKEIAANDLARQALAVRMAQEEEWERVALAHNPMLQLPSGEVTL